MLFPGSPASSARCGRSKKAQKLELREALEKVRLLATRDELTGLSNRRHALELLAQEERKASRNAVLSCFALIDIDHFKRINDTLGHSQQLARPGRPGRPAGYLLSRCLFAPGRRDNPGIHCPRRCRAVPRQGGGAQ
ncbi:MAG: hypothetical protein CFE43_18510 [Burkholderiales bacterium PBB3]|nr:MAG: hypothetical protein CFE43_18510 [Burkholderiales bacterium PBB3]